MKFENLRGRPGFLAVWACLVLFLAGSTFYMADFHGSHSNRSRSGPDNVIMQLAEAAPDSGADNVDLLSRVIMGEATGEPYDGKVAIGAVMLNRMQASSFPHTLAGVIFQPDAFESVSNGLIWSDQPSSDDVRAAIAALSGWDPSHGALYFWNPSKPVSPWIWTRQIVTQIGHQVFGK
jgi:N-acetylmuramoyl-L-alanine amidase